MTSTMVFDPFSDEFYADPHATYPWLRRDAPVYYNSEHDFYALSRHADVALAYKSYETFSSAYGVDLASVRTGKKYPLNIIISIDPPEHRLMRSLVNRVFTPRAVAGLEPLIRQQIDRFLGEVDPVNFDVVQDFSALFPVEVITQMLGVPADYRQQVREWIDVSLHREPGQIEMSQAGIEAQTAMMAMYYELIQERRAQPRDDMISDLLAVEVRREDGERSKLKGREIAGFASLLGGAGAETVAKLIGSAVAEFAQHRGEWDKLLADPAKIPDSIEELLRYDSPVQYNVRRSVKEVALHGVTIPEGAAVFLLGASANRDSDAWTDPDVFNIDRDRSEAQNLGLGYGIHSCLGAALARLEGSIALRSLMDFMPRYEVQWDGCKRVMMQNVSGWSHVPVTVLR